MTWPGWRVATIGVALGLGSYWGLEYLAPDFTGRERKGIFGTIMLAIMALIFAGLWLEGWYRRRYPPEKQAPSKRRSKTAIRKSERKSKARH